jgi:hypothetical protein
MQESKDAPKGEPKGDVRPDEKPALAASSAPEAARKVDPNDVVAVMKAAKLPEEAPSLRTPDEWAIAFEHTNPTFVSEAKPGEVYAPRPEGRPPAGSLRRWIFLTTAAHHGWGTKLPIDQRITREAYEKAVESALGVSLGEHHRDLKAEEKARAEAARKEKAR